MSQCNAGLRIGGSCHLYTKAFVNQVQKKGGGHRHPVLTAFRGLYPAFSTNATSTVTESLLPG